MTVNLKEYAKSTFLSERIVGIYVEYRSDGYENY